MKNKIITMDYTSQTMFNLETMTINTNIPRQRFKYLMIAESNYNKPGILQMLLFVEYEKFSYHAQALLQHMKDNNLGVVFINGGGHITFEPPVSVVHVSGKSYAFGKAHPQELENFITEIFPDFSVDTTCMHIDPVRRSMALTGEMFTWEQVKDEAENP